MSMIIMIRAVLVANRSDAQTEVRSIFLVARMFTN